MISGRETGSSRGKCLPEGGCGVLYPVSDLSDIILTGDDGLRP